MAVLILLVVFPVPLAIALTATFAVNVLVQGRPVGSLPVCLWAVHGCAALAALSQQLMHQALGGREVYGCRGRSLGNCRAAKQLFSELCLH